MSDAKAELAYGIDDRPPLGEAVPLAAQHVVAMFSIATLNKLIPIPTENQNHSANANAPGHAISGSILLSIIAK